MDRQSGTADDGVCKKCKGAGYLRQNVPVGDPQFGKTLECECRVVEKKAKRQQVLLERSGIGNRLQDDSLETFRPVTGCRRAYKIACEYARDPSGWLVLLGPYGCGKTHLAIGILKERIKAGQMSLFRTVPDLLDDLRSGFSPGAEQSYNEKFEEVRNIDFLVLDDYGAQSCTPWETEKLFQLFNHRYNSGAPTVITSNNMSLEGIDPRILSRLSEQKLVNIERMEKARDYRPHSAEGLTENRRT
jgi:DNA replication protein DnaC